MVVLSGLSQEDHDMIAVVEHFGAVVTTTTDHSELTSAGFPSWHRLKGTGGLGRAIDFKPGGGRVDKASHLSLFVDVASRFGGRHTHELICGWSSYWIKDGRHVLWDDNSPSSAKLRAQHLNHIHWSIALGYRPSVVGEGEAVVAAKDVVSVCRCWSGGCPGYFKLQADGGVVSTDDPPHTGDHFRGSYFSLPSPQAVRRFVEIVDVAGVGYYLFAADGGYWGPVIP